MLHKTSFSNYSKTFSPSAPSVIDKGKSLAVSFIINAIAFVGDQLAYWKVQKRYYSSKFRCYNIPIIFVKEINLVWHDVIFQYGDDFWRKFPLILGFSLEITAYTNTYKFQNEAHLSCAKRNDNLFLLQFFLLNYLSVDIDKFVVWFFFRFRFHFSSFRWQCPMIGPVRVLIFSRSNSST